MALYQKEQFYVFTDKIKQLMNLMQHKLNELRYDAKKSKSYLKAVIGYIVIITLAVVGVGVALSVFIVLAFGLLASFIMDLLTGYKFHYDIRQINILWLGLIVLGIMAGFKMHIAIGLFFLFVAGAGFWQRIERKR